MPEPKITDADLELLLAEADRDDPFLSAPRVEDCGRAARVARLADPRRPRQPVAHGGRSGSADRSPPSAALAAARRAVAAASPTRSSPQKTPRATDSAGSRSAPAPSRRRDAASIAPSRRSSRAAFRQPSSRRPGGRTRLGEDLEVVEVEAAREREPRRRQHERPAAALLGRVVRDAHRGRHRHRPALRPLQRQAQRRGALLREVDDLLHVAEVGRHGRAAQRARARRRPRHLVEGPIDPLRRQIRERRREVE